MNQTLRDYPVTHGGVRPVVHPRLGVQVNGQTSVRYMRFLRPVRIDKLELPVEVRGRWIPSVPAHPAHLILSVLDPRTKAWRTIREVDLPRDPRIAGEGLSQKMSIDEMNKSFEPVLKGPPHVIDLGGLETDHLRVECDREHDVWPNHGECNGVPFSVPFGILDPLRAIGEAKGGGIAQTPRSPLLKAGKIQSRAPRGMKVRDLPHMLLFESKRLSVGFSLRRPMLMHLGWDALGERAGENRLLATKAGSRLAGHLTGLSGPVIRTLGVDIGSHLWTGEVSVRGNRVSYRRCRALDGLMIDADFTVEADRLTVELTQTCDDPMAALEAEAWRFAFNLDRGITGIAAVPTLVPGRNGQAELPAMISTDGVGGLSLRRIEGDPNVARLHVESVRAVRAVVAGLVLHESPAIDRPAILADGTDRAVFELAVGAFEPDPRDAARRPLNKAGAGLRRHWGTTFACFRPELGGFSNHAASTNCHVNQGAPIEIAGHTKTPKHGPDPIRLAQFTIERAVLGGGGYGFWRNLYLDSDPVLMSAVGRIHQARPDRAWLERLAPGLRETARRMLGEIGPNGLVLCKDLSGNTGSFRWSSNAMDVVGFGHLDAYVNSWAYRAFRNGAALFDELNDADLSHRCRDAAAALRASFAKELMNPKTGWVAGWRSRDGQLHDYAFLFVNGPALAFGLLDKPAAKRALAGLEKLRDKIGMSSARVGLPCNLLPIHQDDQMWSKIVDSPQPTFENYTDGSACGAPGLYYLRALSIYGLKDRARKLASDLDSGLEAGMFTGPEGHGAEFRSWEGLPTGYEGTLIVCVGAVYAIAIEQGVIEPREPEWWPANG